MKRIYLIIIWMLVAVLPSMAAKSYEMEVNNLVQVNETEFTFDMRMRNTNPSEPFAIEAIQWQLSFNTAMMNGGNLNNTYLTYINGTTDLEGVIIPQSANFSTDQVVIQWITDIVGDGAQTTVFGDGAWKRIGTFRVQLRNSGNTAFQNFADVAHGLAFVPGQVIVYACNYTGTGPYYRSGAFFELITNKTLTNNLSTRQLAGYYFSGTGNWNAGARWNNVTTANSNTLPGAANNAIVAGTATVTDTRTVNQLIVRTGAYLVLNQAAQLTATTMYNDNSSGGGSGVITIANWDFENTGITIFPYNADGGNTSNAGFAPFNTTATFEAFYDYIEHGIPGGTRAPFAITWRPGPTTGVQKDWNIAISTSGYQNLKLSSKQWSDINNDWGAATPGPSQFIIQWSTDGASWTNVSGGTVNVSNDWTTGTVSNLSLPSNINNLSTVYIRWLTNSLKAASGYSSIDDIQITGEALPSGVLIQSTASGTGSLIQSSSGVNASMQRYIPGADWAVWDDGWHDLSSPVKAQAISPEFTTEPYDFYCWYEPGNEWVNYQATTGTPWATGNTIHNNLTNNPDNFLIGKGYLVAYDNDVTKTFTGELNVGDVSISGLTITGTTATNRSWHLLGNPYSSALTWGTGWTLTNIGGVAKIWNGAAKSYSDRSGGQAIPSTNGFMIQVSTEPGEITMPASARTHDLQAWYKSAEPSLMLIAHNNDNPSTQESIFRINEEATPEFDFQYDGEFLEGYAPQFYSVAGDVHLSTNCVPEISSTTSIPFSFIKNEGTNFSIEATGAETMGTEVWLLDNKTGIDHNLSINPMFSFSAAPGDAAERFVLHFGTLSIIDNPTQNDFSLWYNQGELHFSSLPGNALSISLIDMAGRELIHMDKPLSDVISLGNRLGTGWYLARVMMTDKVVVKKIYIN